MRVLVTGASGFIGREIAAELIVNQHEVIALQNSRIDPVSDVKGLQRIAADITEYKNLADLENFTGIGAVIHAAGLAHQFGVTSAEEFERVNVRGTENIARLAIELKAEHFLLIGSTAVYGIQPANSSQIIYTEETPPIPQTLYAASKLAAEKVCQKMCRENSINLTILRLAPVIGEANVGNVARLISAIDHRRFVWIGQGDNLKSLIYKRDVARACAALIANKQPREEIFNLAAEPILMKDFVEAIAQKLNRGILPLAIPASVLRTGFQINAKLFGVGKISRLSDTVEKWLADDVYAADKIAQAYGFKPPTPILEALAKQIDYYRSATK